LSRLVSYAVVIGGGLFLLCACARQGRPTLTPTEAPLSARTAVPTPTSTSTPLPSPSPASEPAGQPLTYTLTVTDHGPSVTDLAIEVPGLVQVVPGETTLYTLTIHNRGPALATGIVLTDVFPKGVIPVWTQPAQPVCGRQARDVGCDLGDLQESDAATVTLDLSVGGSETLVTETQLAGVTLDLSAGTCAIGPDATQPHVTCRLSSLQPGTDAQIRIGAGRVPERSGADVDAQVTGTLVHTVSVAANEADANRANNRATFTMTVGAAGPVTATVVPTTTALVLQADGPSIVIAGQPFTYTYTITNRGALDATDVRFEDALPSDVNLIAYAPGLPLCEQRDDRLTCYLGDPDSSETITFTLVITGHGGQPMKMVPDPLMPGWPTCFVLKERSWLHVVHCELGVLKRGQATRVQLTLMAIGVAQRMTANTVSVSARVPERSGAGRVPERSGVGNETELNPLDITNTVTMTVQVSADLLLWSALSGPAVAGETLSYTLSVANIGPSDTDDVVLTDTLPMGTRLISAVPSQGDDCRTERDASAGTVICSLGRLSGGKIASVTIVVAVDESLTLALPEAITHSARVTARSPDPNPSNNGLTETIPVNVSVEE
jgi:uncharacterized repeat protein (TIGR01451 family)